MKPFKTRLTTKLGIELPIMSAGMAGVADQNLLLLFRTLVGWNIGQTGMDPEVLRHIIRDT